MEESVVGDTGGDLSPTSEESSQGIYRLVIIE